MEAKASFEKAEKRRRKLKSQQGREKVKKEQEKIARKNIGRDKKRNLKC
jgi:hypothetical protein